MKYAFNAFGCLLITLLVFRGARIRAAESEPADPLVTITAEGGVFYGSVGGFLQTPNGGAPGTSSSHRPTLHELGIDDAVLYEAGLRAQRSYAKAAVRLGVEGAWHFNAPLSLGLDGAASLPLENTPQIATVRGVAQWHLAPRSHWLRPTLFLGAGAEWIDYEDRQQVP